MSERRSYASGEKTRERLITTLRLLRKAGSYPTAKELAAITGISFTNVRHHLRVLEESGWITSREVPVNMVRHEIVLCDHAEAAREG